MRLRTKLIVDFYIGSLLHAALKPPTILAGRLLRRDHDLRRCRSVAVVKMLGGGSLVIAYPALLAIRRAPQVRNLRLVTTPEVKPFAELLGVFDEIIVIRDRSAAAMLADAFSALRRLFRHDAIVDLEVHSRLTTVFSLLTCARNRVGFYTENSFWRRRISTHLLFCNLHNGIYHAYDQVAALLGAPKLGAEECRAAFRAATGLAPAVPGAAARRVAVAPCCSELSRERMFTAGEWIPVLRRLLGAAPAGTLFDLLGGPADRAYLEALAGLIRAEFPGAVAVNHAGALSLAQSVQRMAAADRLFCIDSALLHFARLLGIPTASFWGPSDPASRLRDWPGQRDEVHYRKLACSPCVHLAQQAPCGGNNLCMRLAADPSLQAAANPAWVVAHRGVRRFRRASAP